MCSTSILYCIREIPFQLGSLTLKGLRLFMCNDNFQEDISSLLFSKKHFSNELTCAVSSISCKRLFACTKVTSHSVCTRGIFITVVTVFTTFVQVCSEVYEMDNTKVRVACFLAIALSKKGIVERQNCQYLTKYVNQTLKSINQSINH